MRHDVSRSAEDDRAVRIEALFRGPDPPVHHEQRTIAGVDAALAVRQQMPVDVFHTEDGLRHVLPMGTHLQEAQIIELVDRLLAPVSTARSVELQEERGREPISSYVSAN